ncbi:hypothetical protein CR513_24665, partial [Mucuna pruriens]
MISGKNKSSITSVKSSRNMSKGTQHYSEHAAKRLRQYMLAHTTWLIDKMDPLKYIFENPALTRRIVRWKMTLSKYDIVYTSHKAIKGTALAEQLAYHPLDEYHPLSHEFQDEHIMAAAKDEHEAELD